MFQLDSKMPPGIIFYFYIHESKYPSFGNEINKINKNRKQSIPAMAATPNHNITRKQVNSLAFYMSIN